LAVIISFLVGPAAAAAPVVISAVTVDSRDGRIEARLRLETPAKISAFLLPGPQPRLVFDLPPAVVAQGGGLAVNGSFDTVHGRVRFARRTPGASRVVLDLPAEAGDLEVRRSMVGGYLEVAAVARLRQPRPAPTPQAKSQAKHQAKPQVEPQAEPQAEPSGSYAQARLVSAPARPSARQRPLIVLDAGHGGRDPGASSTHGDQEKTITLAAARELQSLLEAKGFRVRLTRDDDAYVSLDERVERARDWGADLFLSLHADAAESAALTGASVYTLSAKGGKRARRYRYAKDWAEAADDPLITDIVFDLTQQSSLERSSDFAETLLRSLDGTVPVVRNARRTAAFYVLQAPEVPAVLLEMGFLTNSRDADRLRTAGGRAPLLKAVVRAVDEHFAARTLLARTEAGFGAP